MPADEKAKEKEIMTAYFAQWVASVRRADDGSVDLYPGDPSSALAEEPAA